MTTLILVRHGQTEWNRVERFRGRFDIPLNDTGIRQAQAAAQRITRDFQPAAVFSSPLARAYRTAEEIASCAGLTVQIEEGLLDIHYGSWQGLTTEEARVKWPDQIDNWLRSPSHVSIPDGESLLGIRRRVQKTIQRLNQRFPDQTIVAVGHVVIIRILLLWALGMHTDRLWDLGPDPCAINIMEFSNGHARLLCMNDTCHLLHT